jgi:protein-L-isoaspartate(D-aspartate) O-methyltransferase
MRAAVSALALLGLSAAAQAAGAFEAERRRMVDEIGAMARSMVRDTGIAEFSPQVIAAMQAVPRHEFVPPEQRAAAYRNRPLPIGHNQTISQPFIVAMMTELLQVKSDHRILEVGTGSGYQAAVLAGLAREVYSIEIIRELGETAAATLQRLGYANVTARIGDGYQGWPEHAPFDGIIVTAAPDHVPPALIEQLKPNGRLVIPVGDVFQDLMVITKNPDGTTTSTAIVPVRFVPLIREK